MRFVLALASLSLIACSAGADDVADHHESDEPIAASSEALSATDTVATAVAQTCSTTAVKGLATQLVGEIQCLRPNTLARIDNTAGLSLGSAVFPYLQTSAAKALVAAQKARGTTMTINSALRTLPQQYLLYRWYQTGRCGISLAASPGTSNHEGAIAVDIQDNAGWRSALTGKSFRWLGASDPVHYDYVGGGTVSLRGLSVTAFQRLWNRNHPNDLIPEDGAYGPTTADRLAKSPVGGFAKGPSCTPTSNADAGAKKPDAGDAGDAPEDTTPVPDADEPDDVSPTTTTTSAAAPPDDASRSASADTGGCAASGTPAGGAPALVLAALTLALRKRRRR